MNHERFNHFPGQIDQVGIDRRSDSWASFAAAGQSLKFA
jgi:hypothetical protein